MISVIIPFQSEDEQRIKAHRWILGWWETHFPDWEILTGGCQGEFTKGKAAQLGVQEANGNVLVIADADSFIYNHISFKNQVERVGTDFEWYVPHNKVHRLSDEATNELYNTGNLDIAAVHYPPYFGCIGGGIVCLTREAWMKSGGIDPRFVGWGGEDRSFGYALTLLVGKPHQGTEKLVHLWHGNQGPRGKISPESFRLIKLYQDARYDHAKMLSLICGR